MKRLTFGLLCASMSCLQFMSCSSNQFEDSLLRDSVEAVQKKAKGESRTELDVTKFAKRLLGGESAATCDVIMKNNISRSEINALDTLAYVVNMSDNGGFVVVAKSELVPPVLAFSDTGNINLSLAEDEIHPFGEFVSRLPQYLENKESEGNIYPMSDSQITLIPSGEVVYPNRAYLVNNIMPVGSWSQDGVWAKYVNISYPGCDAGCVPVATSKAMMFAKDYHEYSSALDLNPDTIPFNFKRLRDVMIEYQTLLREDNLYTEIIQKYEEAQDSVALLIALTGKEMGTKYGVGNSSTFSHAAYYLLIRHGYYMPNATRLYIEYDDVDILGSILDDGIVIMSGIEQHGIGHQWIIDGAAYSYNKDLFRDLNTPIIRPIHGYGIYENIWLHCDWGWNGYCNGYYLGDVFEVENGDNYSSLRYLPVMRE